MELDAMWIIGENPPGYDAPRWMRSAAVAKDGTVYVPAAVTGNEVAAVWAAVCEGTILILFDSGHAYLPSSWISLEFPQVAGICEIIRSNVTRYVADHRPDWIR